MSDTLHRQQIGQRLRLAREALGFGLREFARMHEIDPSKLSHWERGKHIPDQAYLRILWEEYRIGPNFLFFGAVAGIPHEVVDYSRAAAKASDKAE